MYQPTLGRFLSRDPLSADGLFTVGSAGFYADRAWAMSADPFQYGGNSEHPYVYARNNPVRYVDPSGLDSTTPCGCCTNAEAQNPGQMPAPMQGCKCAMVKITTADDFFAQNPKVGATTACVKRQVVPIINWKLIGPNELLCGILECRAEHEQRIADLMKTAGCECPSIFGKNKIAIMGWNSEECAQKSECYAHQRGLECLSRRLASASLLCTAVIWADIKRRLHLMKDEYNCNKHGIPAVPPGGAK